MLMSMSINIYILLLILPNLKGCRVLLSRSFSNRLSSRGARTYCTTAVVHVQIFEFAHPSPLTTALILYYCTPPCSTVKVSNFTGS